MGVGAKLFTLAGLALVYGISSSIIVGLITFIIERIYAAAEVNLLQRLRFDHSYLRMGAE